MKLIKENHKQQNNRNLKVLIIIAVFAVIAAVIVVFKAFSPGSGSEGVQNEQDFQAAQTAEASAAKAYSRGGLINKAYEIIAEEGELYIKVPFKGRVTDAKGVRKETDAIYYYAVYDREREMPVLRKKIWVDYSGVPVKEEKYITEGGSYIMKGYFRDRVKIEEFNIMIFEMTDAEYYDGDFEPLKSDE
ncbi:MAG: hypothetical protein ACLFP1_07690 [Candidatus Goldiibacteriota bacterium]